VAEMWPRIDTWGVEWVSNGYRMGIEWVSTIGLKCQNNGQVRHKYTKLMKKPTPATPMRPLFEGGGVGLFSLNQWLIPMVIRDRGNFLLNSIPKYFFSAVKVKKIFFNL